MRTIEWRTTNAYDSVLVYDEERLVTVFSPATRQDIKDMLVALGNLEDWSGRDPDDQEPSESYGDDGGAYVEAWVWVPPPPDEEDTPDA